jgi:ABC-type branched-subunit amino acid transport system substrate-binding protein
MSRDIDRRKLLKRIGGASIFGLAGCVTQSGGGGGGGSTETATQTETEQETVKPIDAPGYDDGDSDSDDDGGGGGGGRTVKLGILMPETGDLASVGQPIRDGALLPAVQLEDADVPVSIDTQVEDTATDPQQGIQAANALVNAGYPMVTGPASSGVNLQVAQQVFIPNSVVGCSPSSTSPNVTGLDDNDFIFRTAPSDALQGQVMAQVADEKLGDSTASTMYVNNDYGQALSDSFVSSFRDEHSGSINETVAFEKEKSSYTSELETALSDSPSLLVIIGYPASGIQIFRDFYADFSDSDVDILVTDGLRDSTLPDEVGNDMANVTGTAPLASGPGREFYDQLYTDEYGAEPGVFTAQAYDASAVLILANAYAGSNDGAAVRDALREVANPDGETMGPSDLAAAVEMAANGESINYTGASSSVNFDDNGDMGAVAYEYFGYNTSVETNIEQLDTIEFGA